MSNTEVASSSSSSSFEPQSPHSPLSIGVAESPIRAAVGNECSTPIRTRAPEHFTETRNQGLLTYSTPELAAHQQASLVLQSLEYLKKVQLSAIQARTALASATGPIRKQTPRVNFHSIEDLATSDTSTTSSESMVDSGFCSSSYANHTSQKSTDDLSDSEDIEVSENKENERKSAIDLANVNNSKKLRTTFTEQQKRALEVYFQRNPYPDPRETEELSQQLVLAENVIKVWFQNKRSRDKQRKFSHKSRHVASIGSDSVNSPATSSSAFSSPLVANLQMLTSKFNSYHAVVAAAAAQAQQNLNSKLYF